VSAHAQPAPPAPDTVSIRGSGSWLGEAARYVGPWLLAGALGAGAFGAGAGVQGASLRPLPDPGVAACESRLSALEKSVSALDRKLSVALCRLDRKLCEL